MGFLHAIESAEKLLASIDYDGRAAYGSEGWCWMIFGKIMKISVKNI